ncbi:MAG: hypothetical protein ABIE36_02170 [Candidatus Diapherotrites archaeon]
MEKIRGVSGSFPKPPYFSTATKYLVLTLFVIILFILFSSGFGIFDLFKDKSVSEENYCGDGTSYNSCSLIKPYFCLNGSLIENSSQCECYEKQIKQGEFCLSFYQTRPKEIKMEYILNGEINYLNFTVYEGFVNYLSGISKSITYFGEEFPSRVEFKLKNIDEEEQRKMLRPLVIKIQNITSNKEDQIRIAISLVQNIPYGNSNETMMFGNHKINYSRYPYEVLYDMGGVCGEKTDLLAFLLKEMGYGVSFFYYPEENHEALGIKCPLQESLEKSGYCFVETTGPAILTDNEIYYVGIGRLSSSPEIYLIKNGESIGENFREYKDAKKLIRIRKFIEKNGWLGPIRERIFEDIKKEYGLAEEYYG